MKHILAIILVFIMLAFENKIETFTDRSCKINPFKLDNLKTKFIKETKKTINTPSNSGICETFYSKKNLWIYNSTEYNSKKWSSFGSRNTELKSSGIVDTCTDSVVYNLSELYNIRIIDQSDLKKLIPEFIKYFNKCKDEYEFNYLVKYAIIYKFGGVWLPKDILVINKFQVPDKEYYSNCIISFMSNNTNYVNNTGVSDRIFASKKGNPVLKNLLIEVIDNLSTFGNSNKFKNYFNIKFNNVSKLQKLYYEPLGLEKDISGNFITFDSLMSVFDNNFINYGQKSFVDLNLSYLDIHPKYSYLNRMSQNQILMGNLFLTTLIKYAFKQKVNIIHSANIHGI